MAGDTRRIIDLETRFWQSMQDKDAETAAAMIADPSMVVGPMGSMTMNPEIYARMTKQGDWTLKSFDLSDIDVVFPNESTAVVGYRVHQKGELKGKPMDMVCADSTVWVRDGADWKVVLHSETILENAAAKEPEPA